MSTGSLSQGVKRPGRGIDHTTPSGAEVKEGVKFYLDSPCGPSWPVLGRPLPFTYIIYIFFKLWKKGNDLFSFFLSFFLSYPRASIIDILKLLAYVTTVLTSIQFTTAVLLIFIWSAANTFLGYVTRI